MTRDLVPTRHFAKSHRPRNQKPLKHQRQQRVQQQRHHDQGDNRTPIAEDFAQLLQSQPREAAEHLTAAGPMGTDRAALCSRIVHLDQQIRAGKCAKSGI
jgi:hypothetical protein